MVHGSTAPSCNRQRLVGNHQVHVVIDGVAEALAALAGAVGIVEAEQARLGLDEFLAAALAGELLVEADAFRRRRAGSKITSPASR